MKKNQKSDIETIIKIFYFNINKVGCKFDFFLKLLLSFICLNIISAHSQIIENQSHIFGVGYQYFFESHNTKFDNLNVYYVNKNNYYLNFGIKIGFSNSRSSKYEYEKTTVIDSGKAVAGEFKKSLDIDYTSFNVGLFYPVFPFENTQITFGTDLVYITDNSFHYKEEIISPVDVVYMDPKLRIRNEHTGKISNINSYQFQFTSTFEYMIPLNRRKSWYLAPNIGISYRFTELIDNSDLTYFGYGIGLSLKYRFQQ